MLKFKEEVSTLKCEFASILLNVERQALAQKNDSAALKQFHSQFCVHLFSRDYCRLVVVMM